MRTDAHSLSDHKTAFHGFRISLFLPLSIWRHRELIRQFTIREIQGRYKGSVLGLFWSFLTPIAMLLAYTFVFGVIFKARWQHARGGDSLAEFALVLFAGQTAFQFFSEPVSRASGLILGVPNFVKKVVFPLEIIPISAVAAAAYHVLISIVICIFASLIIIGSLPWTILLIPFSLLPLAALSLGMTWFLASLGVYLRDMGQLVAVIVQVLFFATPIFYPITAIPEPYRALIMLNPLSSMVELVRAHLIIGTWGDPIMWVIAYGTGFIALLLGYMWFSITKRGFADVL